MLVATQKNIIFVIANKHTTRRVDILKQMNIRNKRFSLLITFSLVTLLVLAQQTGTNSPYGRYGYGPLSNSTFGASEAMGGISYGLRKSQQVNPGNPASYSKLDSLTFIFDYGVSGQMTRLSDIEQTYDYYNANLEYVAMQFPLFRKMGGSIGLLPYSKIGYNYGNARSLSNIIYQETYRASGGLSQLYAGLAYEPIKALSIGANISYLFGNTYYSNVLIPLTSTGALIGEERSSYAFRGYKLDFGLQYTHAIDNKSQLVLGAVYSPKVSSKSDLIISNKLYNTDPNTLSNPELYVVQTLRDDTLQSRVFELPHTIGLGATYSNNNLLIGLDGTWQKWKNLQYPSELDGLQQDNRFNDVYRINAGAEFVADPLSRSFWSTLRLRAGFSFANSYTNVNAYNPQSHTLSAIAGYKEYGLNFGLGIPLKSNITGKLSMLNIGFMYNMKRPENEFMIKEDLFKISINMNINELWFFKRQFD